VIKQLSLADVKLYDPFGGDIFSAAAVFWASSVNVVYGVIQQPASNCNDGNLDTICATAGTWSDSNPALRIYYSCPLGSTALSRVVVQSDPSRRDVLNVFSLHFVNSEYVADRPAYRFSGTQQTYTIPTTGMHRHAYLCAQPRLSLCKGSSIHWRRPPPTPRTGSCGVVIRPAANVPSGMSLVLAEVKLIDAVGRLLDRSKLAFELSSAYWYYEAGYCNDGDAQTWCWARNDDSVQTLRIAYPCDGSGTTLSSVVVAAAPGYESLLSAFALDFLNAAGTKDRASYTFSGAVLTYVVPTMGAQRQHALV
jgi:hypothetical protein